MPRAAANQLTALIRSSSRGQPPASAAATNASGHSDPQSLGKRSFSRSETTKQNPIAEREKVRGPGPQSQAPKGQYANDGPFSRSTRFVLAVAWRWASRCKGLCIMGSPGEVDPKACREPAQSCLSTEILKPPGPMSGVGGWRVGVEGPQRQGS
ncbi:hypothetical protein [Desulfotomaculum defluvii]